MVVLCLLWIVFSNKIISIYLNRNTPITSMQNIENQSIAPVYYGLDIVEFQNGFFETLEVSGWAFSEGIEDQRVYLLLQSDDVLYKVQCANSQRSDIYGLYISNDYDVNNDMVGFYANISTIGIAEGIYELGLIIADNEGYIGMIEIGKSFLKDGIQMQEIECSPTSLELENELIEGCNTRFAIDDIEIDLENSILKISGWGVVFGVVNTKEKYVKIETETGINYYEVASKYRKDIADVFGMEYSLSGFWAEIPIEVFDEGKMAISLVLKDKDDFYVTEAKDYSYEGKIIKQLDYREKELDEILMDNAEILHCGIDGFSYNVNQLVVSGWALNSDEETVYIRISNESGAYMDFIPEQDIERSDISNAFGEDYLYSGFFLSTISTNLSTKLGNEELSFQIISVNEQMECSVSESYPLTWQE